MGFDMDNTCPEAAIVILAAGPGTRMKSDKAKVLHEIAGKPMVDYVLGASFNVVPGGKIIVVVGCQADRVRRQIQQNWNVLFAYQAGQLGTGHAVQCAIDHIPDCATDVVILCGDVPFITSRTIGNLLAEHRDQKNDVTVLSVNLDVPAGYGRIVTDENNTITRIVEEADADPDEKAITLVNAGVYCVKTGVLARVLGRIRSDNRQNELYLTDIVFIARNEGMRVGTLISPNPDEVIGVNSLADLQKAESVL